MNWISLIGTLTLTACSLLYKAIDTGYVKYSVINWELHAWVVIYLGNS